MTKHPPKNCEACGKEIESTRTKSAKYCLKCKEKRLKQQRKKASLKHYKKLPRETPLGRDSKLSEFLEESEWLQIW